MKAKSLNAELIDLIKESGIKLRREIGKFRSGFAIANNQEYIIINKVAPVETQNVLLARSLPERVLKSYYIKPAVREFIENEREGMKEIQEYSIEIGNDENELLQ
tara:strand:+ start:69 stop:383 length:315 start_codon:yes stop_codon:yes gene_type:complete